MAWSVLQSASLAKTGGTTTAVAFGTNLSSGTKIIVATVVSGNTTVASVKDGAGNSATLIASKVSGVVASAYLYAMDTPAGDVGTTPTITVTWNASTPATAILIQEVSGLLPGNTTAMVDGTPGTLTNNTTGSIGPPSYTTTAANEYLVYMYADDGGPLTWTVPGGYTGDANGVNGSSNTDIQIAYANSTNGTETGQYSITGTAAEWFLIMAAFKLPAASTTAIAAPPVPGFIAAQRHQDVLPLPPQNTAQIPPASVTPVNPAFPGFIAWSRREPLSPVPPLVLVQGTLPPPPVPPQLLRQPQPNRLILRRSQGKFFPPLPQANQGVQFPLFTRQPSPRITLRRSQGRFFNPGQFNLAAPQLPSFPRQAGTRRPLRRSQGTFFNQAWGQANQGVQFPLYLRARSRPVPFRISRGRFFHPGQFNLDGNPYTGFFRQAQRTRVTLRRSQGRFFSQEWAQANQGTPFPQFLQQALTRRLSIRYPRGQFQFIPPPPPVTAVSTPLVNPIPGFIAVQRHLLDLFPAQAFAQGALPPVTTVPQFLGRTARPVPRPGRGRFFNPGQFNFTAPQYPNITRAGSRPVPARARRGRFFEPGQFNETANPSLPSFTRTPKRPSLPARRGIIFPVVPPPVLTLPLLSPRRPKLSPPRRGKFGQRNIPQAVIPVWPPEFRTTRRVNFTRIRRGSIIKLAPFQFPATQAPVFTTGIMQFRWVTDTMSTRWDTGTEGFRWVTGSLKQEWKAG